MALLTLPFDTVIDLTIGRGSFDISRPGQYCYAAQDLIK
jgi:hypothetical protein